MIKRLLTAAALAVTMSACGAPEVRTVYVPTPVANTLDGERVQLYTKGSNAMYVKALVNGSIPVAFQLDSGADSVLVSPNLVRALIANGTITDADVIGPGRASVASGEVIPTYVFRLKSIQVGHKVAHNVLATVAPGVPDGGMLLGQSFLRQFKHWSVDNNAGHLILAV